MDHNHIMTRKKQPLTPDQVRAQFRARGQSFKEWALEHGWDHKAVSRVLTGCEKGYRGRSHEIAVALGLKLPADESSAADADSNMQSRKVA